MAIQDDDSIQSNNSTHNYVVIEPGIAQQTSLSNEHDNSLPHENKEQEEVPVFDFTNFPKHDNVDQYETPDQKELEQQNSTTPIEETVDIESQTFDQNSLQMSDIEGAIINNPNEEISVSSKVAEDTEYVGHNSKKKTKPKWNKPRHDKRIEKEIPNETSVDLSKLKNIQEVWRERAMHPVKRPFGQNKHIAAILSKNKMLDIIDPNEDGETHININYTGKTNLGKVLDLNSKSDFSHPDLGKFATLSGMWHWLCGKQSDEYRTLWGGPLKEACRDTKLKHIDGFYRIMAEATWYKVIQNENLIKMMIKSVDKNGTPIPFKCYYTQGHAGVPVIHKNSKWYVPILEEIRKVVISNNKIIMDKKSKGEQLLPEDLSVPDFSFCEWIQKD